MANVRRFLSRRRLLAFVGVIALLFGLAMLHPYPRQSLFGPKIHGEPWCVWEARIQYFVNCDKYDKTLSARILRWFGCEPTQMEMRDLFDRAEMLPILIEMADGDDMTICFEILSAIAKYPSLQNRAALPMLQRRMQDDDVDHRRVAMFGIYAIEKNERILMVALDDPCDDNVLWAVLGLEFLGPNAKDAVPFLERRVNDKNEKVRNGVRDALLAIDPERFQHLKSLRKIE